MPGEPHLDVKFRHRIGTLNLDVAFTAQAPWTVLFGPSGSGKSTILRVIAGLARPSDGRVVALGNTIVDTEVKRTIPAHLRPVRFATQRSLLFPYSTVEQNVAFGLWADAAGSTARPQTDEVARALEAFHLGSLARAYPVELSGGQRQRVAVARAAVGASKRLLLLDEPFTGLDATVRDQLITDLRNWLGETPIISVTHDVGEAFLLQADLVRVSEGRVIAQGPVDEVLADERTALMRILS